MNCKSVEVPLHHLPHPVFVIDENYSQEWSLDGLTTCLSLNIVSLAIRGECTSELVIVTERPTWHGLAVQLVD